MKKTAAIIVIMSMLFCTSAEAFEVDSTDREIDAIWMNNAAGWYDSSLGLAFIPEIGWTEADEVQIRSLNDIPDEMNIEDRYAESGYSYIYEAEGPDLEGAVTIVLLDTEVYDPEMETADDVIDFMADNYAALLGNSGYTDIEVIRSECEIGDFTCPAVIGIYEGENGIVYDVSAALEKDGSSVYLIEIECPEEDGIKEISGNFAMLKTAAVPAAPVYSNADLGIECRLPESWYIASTGELAALCGVYSYFSEETVLQEIFDQYGFVYEFYAENKVGLDNISISAESAAGMMVFFTEDRYAEMAIEAGLKEDLEESGIEDLTVEKLSVEFAGETHPCITISGSYAGFEVRESEVIIKANGRFYNISAVTYSGADPAEHLEYFTAAK